MRLAPLWATNGTSSAVVPSLGPSAPTAASEAASSVPVSNYLESLNGLLQGWECNATDPSRGSLASPSLDGGGVTVSPSSAVRVGNVSVVQEGGQSSLAVLVMDARLVSGAVDADGGVSANSTRRATLASPVVGLVPVDSECALLGEPAAPRAVEVVVEIEPEERGMAACVRTDDPAAVHGTNITCVAGCCVQGACACRVGYVGARCDVELRCALVAPGHATFDLTSCGTHHVLRGPNETNRLRCTCNSVGVVAALRFHLTPPTNKGSLGDLPRLLPLLLLPPQCWLLPALLGLLFAVLLLAFWMDCTTLYISSDSPRLLWCLRPRPSAPLWAELRWCALMICLTRSSVLRIVFVAPGFTVYTSQQLVIVLANSIAINALCVALFLERDGEICSAVAALIVTLSTIAASLVASLCRLCFRWANLASGSP